MKGRITPGFEASLKSFRNQAGKSCSKVSPMTSNILNFPLLTDMQKKMKILKTGKFAGGDE